MFQEDELLPISALQHFVFCPRRAALIHLEGLWAENRFTVEGRHLHERAHDPTLSDRRAGMLVTRGLMLRSFRWGLVGRADVVEFHERQTSKPQRIVVVEYKRGKPKADRDEEFRVQLCAQALCLEEMLQRGIDAAAIYFGKAKRRIPVELDESLRERTRDAIEELHRVLQSGRTPPPQYQRRKCERCSLVNHCVPHAPRPRATAERYLQRIVDGYPEEQEP